MERYKLVEPNKLGIDRSCEKHLNSIRINRSYIIKKRNVVLLDDISTTDNTIKACKWILLNAGAEKVTSIVIGKTTHIT